MLTDALKQAIKVYISVNFREKAVNQNHTAGRKPAEKRSYKDQTGTISALRQKYSPWIKKVRNLFISLSDEDVPPDDLHDWADEIVDLAGWVMNLAVILERDPDADEFSGDDIWLIRHAVSRYYRSMEKLKTLEKTPGSC